MYTRTVTLVVALVLLLPSLTDVDASEPTIDEPQLANPQMPAQSINERLDRLELQIRLLQQHLGLRLKLPPASVTRESATNDSLSQDWLGRLEGEKKRFEDRLEQLQRQLDGAKPPGRLVPVVTQGRLVVQNRTGVPHYLSVNKVQYYVWPGRTDIWVPYQPVEAYLPTHEVPKLLGMSLWRWTGSDYEMSLEIKN